MPSPRTAMVAHKPTASETALVTRQEIAHLTQAGWSTAAIAAHLDLSPRTVRRWRQRAREQGSQGLAYRSRRPLRRAPHATPTTVVARIVAIRRAHPGWGARLIRRQLRLDGVVPLPCERTVHAWLVRLGAGPVRPRAHKPTGWPQPVRAPESTLWEVDHTQKGGGTT